MKILLFSINTSTSIFPVYPLGMSVVANVLTEQNHIVEQFDFVTNNKSYEKVEKKISEFNPSIIGISIRNLLKESLDIANEIIKISKKYNKVIFIGGSACNWEFDNIFKGTNADYYFLGPAESNIINFIDNFEKNNLPNSQIIHAKKYKKVYGPLYDIDILKFYSKFNFSVGINTKKGCKYNCFACNNKYVDGNILKYRNISEIIEDIKFLKKQDVKSIFFADSILNDDITFLEELLIEIKNQNIHGIKFTGCLNPGNINKKILLLMKSIGFTSFHLEIEGTTDLTLKGFNKNFKWKDVIELDKILLKLKFINIRAHFLFGGPLEDKNTLFEGISNIKKLHFNPMVIDVFEQCKVNNKIIRHQDVCNISIEYCKEQLIKNFGYIGEKN